MATALAVTLHRDPRSFRSTDRPCPRLNRSTLSKPDGPLGAQRWGISHGRYDWLALRVQQCPVIYAQLPCACLSLFSLQACTFRLAGLVVVLADACVHLLMFVRARVRVGAVIDVGAEILSLYPMPILSLSPTQTPLSPPLPG